MKTVTSTSFLSITIKALFLSLFKVLLLAVLWNIFFPTFHITLWQVFGLNLMYVVYLFKIQVNIKR